MCYAVPNFFIHRRHLVFICHVTVAFNYSILFTEQNIFVFEIFDPYQEFTTDEANAIMNGLLLETMGDREGTT